MYNLPPNVYLNQPTQIRSVDDVGLNQSAQIWSVDDQDTASEQFLKDMIQKRILKFINQFLKDELPEFSDAVEDKEKRDERKRRLEGSRSNASPYYDSPPNKKSTAKNDEKTKRITDLAKEVNHPCYLGKKQRELLNHTRGKSIFQNYEKLRKKKFQDFIDRYSRG